MTKKPIFEIAEKCVSGGGAVRKSLTRRNFLVVGATAVASVALAPAVDRLFGLDSLNFNFDSKAFAASNVRFHDIADLPSLSGEWVCSTLLWPSRVSCSGAAREEAGGSYGKYTIYENTGVGTVRLHNAAIDADSAQCDIVIDIGPVKGLNPRDGLPSWATARWLTFYLVDANEAGTIGWEIDSSFAEGYVKIRYVKAGTDTPANVKIFGTFSDIDQAQGTVQYHCTNAIKNGDEGICFPNQSVDVYAYNDHWMELDANLGGAFFTNPAISGTDGWFDRHSQITAIFNMSWANVYYTGCSCGIYFSFKLPGASVKYFVDGSSAPCYTETWSAGKVHSVSQAATDAAVTPGYESLFSGWYTDEALTSEYNGSVLAEGELKLYARNGVNVRYFVDGELTPCYTEKKKYGASHSVPAAATKAGEKPDCTPGFSGWFSDKALTSKYTGTSKLTRDVDIYGKNVATVSFAYSSQSDHETGQSYYTRPNGDRINLALPSPVKIDCGKTVTFGNLPAVCFRSYSDDHWRTLRAKQWFTDDAMSSAAISKLIVKHDVTVYAVYIESPVDGVEDERNIVKQA